MRRSELHYDLPAERIAQQPCEPRDASRLMVVQRATGQIEHRIFRDVGEYLRPGDCLVLNNTRVIPARFFGRRASGGRVEGLFLHEQDGDWAVLLKPSSRLRVGETLTLIAPDCSTVSTACDTQYSLTLVAQRERGEWRVRPTPPGAAFERLSQFGQAPLPPYIRRERGPSATDEQRYQTVYAAAAGSIAAPTAGLHFTPELLAGLAGRGVRRAEVTLHVGLGTFAAIDVDDLSAHAMHSEEFELGTDAAATIAATRAAGGRIVAVGTTSTRVLESLPEGVIQPARGATRIFLYPPYTFRNVDALLTNFHLPESTLLALVMAFAGRELILRAYAEAIGNEYRFFSFGDAMLIM